MPLISIIVPVYKVEKYLPHCIDSILAQTFTDFELLLIDDGSPDNCGQICDKYAEKDCRIRVFHKENGGLSDARNYGLDRATGSYLMFIDSDDFISEHCLEVLYNNLISCNADVSIGNLQTTDEDGNYHVEKCIPTIEKWTQDSFWDHWKNASSGYCVVAVNKLFCRHILETVRFPKGKLHEDVWALHHWVEMCNVFVATDEKTYFYRQRFGSIMHADYTIKNLEVVEALVQRAYYFQEKRMFDFAEKAAIDAMGRFVKGKQQLILNEDCKIKCDILLNKIRRYNLSSFRYPTSIKFRVLCLIFNTSQSLYKSLVISK